MSTFLRPALSLILLMTLITGVVYPLLVTGVAQLAFATQANGSLVRDESGQVRGSALIAQDFNGDGWFHPRPSAGNFATVASAASNLAPSNPALAERIKADATRLFIAEQGPVPLALLSTSASGLDPDLPVAAVNYQLLRVANARQLSVEIVQDLIATHTQTPMVGPPVINVLALNWALDRLPSATR